MAVFTGAKIKASDNKTYEFRGAQWVEKKSDTKYGRIATRAIAQELDRKAAEKHLSSGPSVFDNLLLKGIRSGKIPARTQEARDWFRNTAKGTEIKERDLLREKTRFVRGIAPGRMYFFQYNPKHAKTLPYYDMFPLIFPIEKYDDGFLGLNFHYLPLPLRAKLMDALYTIASNDKFDEKTKIQASYNTLKGATKFNLFKPTLHKYLNSHVQSRFIEVFSSEWDIALFLPVEAFKKATKAKVWRDSQRKLQ